MIGSPRVTLTPSSKATIFIAMCPWSRYIATTASNSPSNARWKTVSGETGQPRRLLVDRRRDDRVHPARQGQPRGALDRRDRGPACRRVNLAALQGGEVHVGEVQHREAARGEAGLLGARHGVDGEPRAA